MENVLALMRDGVTVFVVGFDVQVYCQIVRFKLLSTRYTVRELYSGKIKDNSVGPWFNSWRG